MRLNEWLKAATSKLDQAGIGTARLDTLILLEDVIGLDRSRLLTEPELDIPAAKLSKLNNLLNKRATHVPLAYLLGKTEFYGHEFLITPDVLEPRPESEAMIDELKKLPGLPAVSRIADVGTGSGALGITAGLELPNTLIELLDVDSRALKVAQMNVDKFTLPVKTVLSDLLLGVNTAYDILLCNLPYVPDGYRINAAASHEPFKAIFGGPDGLDLYRRLFKQADTGQVRPLYILTESLPPQHADLFEIARLKNYQLVTENDFIMVFKRAQ